jgi:hypothetical protein
VLSAYTNGGIRLIGNVDEAKFIRRFRQQEIAMRSMMTGFSGWVRMQDGRSESLKLVDTAITVVATLLAAVTWAMLHH